MGLYEVIIIGAGPAGLKLAQSLKTKNYLILEKEKKYKRIPCAEWIPYFMDLPSIQPTKGMITDYPGGRIYKKASGKIIDRKSWQTKMLSGLQGNVHVNEKATYIEKNTVFTNKGQYQGKWIVGADGPKSILSSHFRTSNKYLPAVNMNVKLKNPLMNTHVVFSLNIPYGYGWLFPKADIANIGLGAYGKLNKPMEYVLSFYKPYIYSKPFNISAGLIPLEVTFPNIIGNKILVGDAGGFIDPITGSGIQYALETGDLTAKLINNELSNEKYIKSIKNIYVRFLNKRARLKDIKESNWKNLYRAVKKSWISFSPG